ncbi:hypothetical protein DXX94_13495 [Thalassotalea euphylliae]|uniref:Uncharacterized protein n=1 Tax=Thalassotalea euphylliae TaxID=1655234 RepID=A0A3E0U3T8_9GAMM|nr:hypothetical protein DXX94_13495 [Thalassotalea euphylliae]
MYLVPIGWDLDQGAARHIPNGHSSQMLMAAVNFLYAINAKGRREKQVNTKVNEHHRTNVTVY